MHLFRKKSENLEILAGDNSKNPSNQSKFKRLIKNPKFWALFVAWNIVYYTAKCSLIVYGGKKVYDYYNSDNSTNQPSIKTNNYFQ